MQSLIRVETHAINNKKLPGLYGLRDLYKTYEVATRRMLRWQCWIEKVNDHMHGTSIGKDGRHFFKICNWDVLSLPSLMQANTGKSSTCHSIRKEKLEK